VTFSFGFFFTDRAGDALSSTDFPRTLNLAAFDSSRAFYGDYWDGTGDLSRNLGLFRALSQR